MKTESKRGRDMGGCNTTDGMVPHLHNLSPLAPRSSRRQQGGPEGGHLDLVLPGNLEIPPGSEPTSAAHGTSL